MTAEDFLNAPMTPRERRNLDRKHKVWDTQHLMYRHIPWMRAPVMQYIYSFWANLFEEGIKDTLKPRWGHVTFGWLNDGMKPTVWHTWRQLTHDHSDPYTGIYTMGAPKSLAQARAWEEEAEAKRWEKYRDEAWEAWQEGW